MKAWKSAIVEGSISMHELRELVEKTVHLPSGAIFTAFVTFGSPHDPVEHRVQLTNGIRFEILLRDATDATSKQG